MRETGSTTQTRWTLEAGGKNVIIIKVIQGYDPVKISIKNFQNTQWLVACMIPKGNMMASTLNKLDDDNYELIEFRCSNKKETPEENRRLEEEFKLFLEKGISKISRQGSIHYIHSAFITLLG